MKKQLKNYIMIVCFLLFIFGFAVASFISEDREFSENENRYLQQAPEFSWKKLEKVPEQEPERRERRHSPRSAD